MTALRAAAGVSALVHEREARAPSGPGLAAVAAGLDAALGGRALVIGSLPPRARDLDLLVRPRERTRAATFLQRNGFTARGDTWARFEPGGPLVVDLIPASRWGLPSREAEALFERARPAPGLARLVLPAPQHELLVLARRLVAEGGLRANHRTRVDGVLEQDPLVWRRARERSRAWGAEIALTALRRAYTTGRPVPLADRVAGLAESRRVAGRPVARAWAGAVRSVLPRRGAVVSVSGLDGAGKTSQADALRESLRLLGFPATVVWNRVAANPSLDAIARPVKRLLGRGGEGPGRSPTAPSVDGRPGPLGWGWPLVVAALNGLAQRRLAGRLVRRGRVVIADRWVLDSLVELRARYGRRPLARLVVRALSPRAVRSFWLDVDPAVAAARRPGTDRRELARTRGLYGALHRRERVTRVDAGRAEDQLAAEIAREAWLALTRPRVPRRGRRS